MHGALLVRGPVRPDVDPMLGRLLEIEEQAIAEYAKERRTANGDEDLGGDRALLFFQVADNEGHNYEYCSAECV